MFCLWRSGIRWMLRCMLPGNSLIKGHLEGQRATSLWWRQVWEVLAVSHCSDLQFQPQYQVLLPQKPDEGRVILFSHWTSFWPLHASHSLLSGREWVTNTQASVVHFSRLFHSCCQALPSASVDSKLSWPQAGLCRVQAKTGRGNRRVSVEEVTCHHVLAEEKACDAIGSQQPRIEGNG